MTAAKKNVSWKVISRFLKIHRSFLWRSICQMLKRKTTNTGRENETETRFHVIVRNFRKVESHFCCWCCFRKKKKGQPRGRQISLGLGLQNRGKNYSATVCSGKGK